MEIPENTLNSSLELHVEAIQTVIPSKVTEGGSRRRISVSGPIRPEIYKQHLHIVLYYEKAHKDESGWAIGGSLKESLNVALSEKPEFAGRIRREGGADGGDGELAIVYNDSGARLVHAEMEMSVSEFLNCSKRGGDAEAKLAFWKDIDEQNPQYSALFYVQVTDFHGDGYSIGFTSSVLLADPMLLAGFIRRWAHIHNTLLEQKEIPKLPTFYLPNFKNAGRFPALPIRSTPCNPNHYQTMAFNLPNVDPKSFMESTDQIESCKAIAKRIAGEDAFSKLSLIFHNRFGDSRVITSAKEGQFRNRDNHEGAVTRLDDPRVSDISFYKGNMPVHVSYRVESCPDEGLVLIMPPVDEGNLGMAINVTVPKNKKNWGI